MHYYLGLLNAHDHAVRAEFFTENATKIIPRQPVIAGKEGNSLMVTLASIKRSNTAMATAGKVITSHHVVTGKQCNITLS